MINSIECFLRIYKYATIKFKLLANRFSDRNKSMGSQTFFPETKLKWIKYF